MNLTEAQLERIGRFFEAVMEWSLSQPSSNECVDEGVGREVIA